jgi:hypothetical protein
MALTMTVKQHDHLIPLDAVLADQDGPIDLTTATAVKLICKIASGATNFTGTCTLVDAANGEVRYMLTSTDLATINTYKGEFEITWASGRIQTVPNTGYFTLVVEADLG